MLRPQRLLLIFLMLSWGNGARGAQLEVSSEPVLRLEGGIHNLQLPNTRAYLAFTNPQGESLRILDLSTHEVVEVSPYKVGPSFFWSPDGTRLFFRELVLENGQILSLLKVHDIGLKKTSTLQTFKGSSGYLSFDPRSFKFFLVHDQGIYQQQLSYPSRFKPRWTQKNSDTIWIASQKSILRLKDGGLSMEAIGDDGSGVQSFAISPDGLSVTWATKAQRVYTMRTDDLTARDIGPGRDPSWHPYHATLVYAAARVVGSKIYDYDIRLVDFQGQSRNLQRSPHIAERWPLWFDPYTIIYSSDNTTDLLRLRLHAPVVKAQQPFSDENGAAG